MRHYFAQWGLLIVSFPADVPGLSELHGALGLAVPLRTTAWTATTTEAQHSDIADPSEPVATPPRAVPSSSTRASAL